MSLNTVTNVLVRLSRGEEVIFDEQNLDLSEVKTHLKDFSDSAVATAIYSLQRMQFTNLAQYMQFEHFTARPRSAPLDFPTEEKKLKLYSLNTDQHVAIGKYVESYCRTVPNADDYTKGNGVIWEWKETTVLRYDPRTLADVEPLCFSYTSIDQRRSSFQSASVVKAWEDVND